MVNNARSKSGSDCPVCYLPHDEETHEATLRIHLWFCGQVTRNLVDEASFEPESHPEQVAS
jgi:hypothetical protein